ncbi:MAG: hypothetical protein QOH90_161 [Actinomycetota bacterium]|nr:hypothetical protein [Actinomycetota bacterium]
MRKPVALLVVGFLFSAAVAAHAGPVPAPRIDRGASASWLIPTAKPHIYIWYGIDVEARETLSEATGVAYAIKGRCKIRRDFGSCGGAGYGVRLKKGDFEMAPDASTASVKFKVKGHNYAAAWTADPLGPSTYSLGEFCSDSDGNEGQGAGAGLYRPSSTRGTYANRKMDGKKDPLQGAFDYVSEGPAVSQCDHGLHLRHAQDGGVSATWTFHLER